VLGVKLAIEQPRRNMVVPVAKYIRFNRYNIANDAFRGKAAAIDLRLHARDHDSAPALRGLWKLLYL
jgi:hypothetical protein